MQLYEPNVFLQTAFCGQGDLNAHSFISTTKQYKRDLEIRNTKMDERNAEAAHHVIQNTYTKHRTH